MAPFFLTLLNVHVARRLHCVTSDYLGCFSFVVVVAVAVVFVVLATMKIRPMVCVHGSSDFLSSDPVAVSLEKSAGIYSNHHVTIRPHYERSGPRNFLTTLHNYKTTQHDKVS